MTYAPLRAPGRDNAPVIETDRLRLRPLQFEDFAKVAAFFTTPRARYVGDLKTPAAVWPEFCANIACWPLLGYGTWAVETHDGAVVGQVGLNFPPQFPELELGWVVLAEFEGRGLAHEAAVAARAWAFAHLPVSSLVSYIHPDNTRSRALAERLGASPDPDAPPPDGADLSQTLVYRHRPEGRT